MVLVTLEVGSGRNRGVKLNVYWGVNHSFGMHSCSW